MTTHSLYYIAETGINRATKAMLYLTEPANLPAEREAVRVTIQLPSEWTLWADDAGAAYCEAKPGRSGSQLWFDRIKKRVILRDAQNETIYAASIR